MALRAKSEAAIDLVARAEAAHVRHVHLQFTDVMGAVKTVTIPAAQLAAAVEHGTWFDGSSVESFARTAESDMYLVPDPGTFQLLPWAAEPTEARPAVPPGARDPPAVRPKASRSARAGARGCRQRSPSGRRSGSARRTSTSLRAPA